MLPLFKNMKTATLLKNNLTKKQLIYIGVAASIAVLTIVGIVVYVFVLQSPTTKASSEAPQNVQVQKPAPDKASVSWGTDTEAVTAIEYGTAPDPSKFQSLPASGSPATQHNIDLTSLEPNTTYYFQIRVGETVYDNDGQYWTFTTNAETATDGTQPDSSLSPTGGVSIVPTPTKSASTSASLTPSTSPSADATPTPSGSICDSTDCAEIQDNLGTLCTTQDYVRCTFGSSDVTTTPTDSDTTVTTDPSVTTSPVTQASKNLCKSSYIQANNCTSWSWESMTNKDKVCGDTFTRYFVQCKSNSFNSNDSANWYCNETTAASSITLPCGSAPTPPAGQSVFCRIRAESDEGGTSNSTDWISGSTSCSAYTTSNISSCAIKYLQSNECRSWIWDLVNNNDATCKAAFSKYFLQCTSNGNFALTTTTPTPAFWYCNKTETNHYLDFPCYNAVTPVDAAPITCRIRAEDAYGGDSHSTAWTTTTVNCPTSTPTPSITATPTHTPTPTATRTPTPTP